MLPNNELSTEPIYDDWLYPHPTAYNPLVDYEMGGIEIEDVSHGLDHSLWKLSYEENDIKLGKVGAVQQTMFTVPDVIKLGLAFDQNMHPCYVWENGADKYVNLIYFDTQINANSVLTISDAHSPCLTLDDHRTGESANSDIILAYITNGQLCYRQQRDRFLIERVLAENVQGKLIQIGMSQSSRLQFKTQYLEYQTSNKEKAYA